MPFGEGIRGLSIMSKTWLKPIAVATILPALINPTSAAGDTAPIAGIWQTAQLSEITIQPCEIGLCGYITKIVIPPEIYEENKEEIDQFGIANAFDHYNKDPLLRDRPIQGLQILTLDGIEPDDRYRGNIYNPEDGNTYTGFVEVLDEDTIRLTGCGFFDLICKSEDWLRVKQTASQENIAVVN